MKRHCYGMISYQLYNLSETGTEIEMISVLVYNTYYYIPIISFLLSIELVECCWILGLGCVKDPSKIPNVHFHLILTFPSLWIKVCCQTLSIILGFQCVWTTRHPSPPWENFILEGGGAGGFFPRPLSCNLIKYQLFFVNLENPFYRFWYSWLYGFSLGAEVACAMFRDADGC